MAALRCHVLSEGTALKHYGSSCMASSLRGDSLTVEGSVDIYFETE